MKNLTSTDIKSVSGGLVIFPGGIWPIPLPGIGQY